MGYYLDESNKWALDVNSLEESTQKAKKEAINLRAIVIINPGNPTGAVFDEKSLQDLFNFAFKNNLVVIADEVYQENIYSPNKQFISAKKVLSQMPANVSQSVELMSFHSCSKGILGECGVRGGYVEMVNIDERAIV